MRFPLDMPWLDAASLQRLTQVTPEEFAAFWATYAPLIDALNRNDAGSIRECWSAFCLLDGDRAEALLGFLVNQLRHHERGVRAAAAAALGKLGDSRAFHGLAERLHDRDDSLRLAIIAALGDLDDPVALPALHALLMARSARLRQAAAEACLRLGDRATPLPVLVELLQCGDWQARQRAAATLAWPGNAGAVHALCCALVDRAAGVRVEAARALGVIGDRAAVPVLLRTLYDRDTDVRRQAATALARIGDPRALEPLYLLADTSDVVVHDLAQQALAQFPRPAAMGKSA